MLETKARHFYDACLTSAENAVGGNGASTLQQVVFRKEGGRWSGGGVEGQFQLCGIDRSWLEPKLERDDLTSATTWFTRRLQPTQVLGD
jgi:hypothetical protein